MRKTRTRIAQAAACLLLAALSARAATQPEPPAASRVHVNPSPVPIADFTLTDQDGRPRAFSSLHGEPTLVFFGFTHCPSICPAAMGELMLLTEALRRDGDPVPRVVLISVDGERDTPARLKSYLGPLSPDFIGLTGDPRLVRDIAARFSAVFFKEIPGDDSGNYDVQHTSLVYLVDAEGALRASFAAAPLEQMAETIRKVAGAPGKAS